MTIAINQAAVALSIQLKVRTIRLMTPFVKRVDRNQFRLDMCGTRLCLPGHSMLRSSFEFPLLQVTGEMKPELDFLHFWKPFVRTFQLLCISHYGIFRPELKKQRFKLFLYRFFFVLNVVLQVAATYFYFEKGLTLKLHAMNKYNVSKIFLYVNVGTRFSQFASQLVVPLETFFKRHVEHELFEAFRRIDDIFKNDLKYPIDYRGHRRRQLTHTWLYYIIVITLMVGSYFISAPVPASVTVIHSLLYFYLLAFWRIRIFQVALYINMLNALLGELTVVMRRQQQRVKYNPHGWKDIQYTRRMYSEFTLVKTLIGDCFGYSLILCVVDSSVKIINSAYWYYVNFETIKSDNMHLR